MKIVLEIKNTSKVLSPIKGDVIMYDGKQWYITTKEELFGEYHKKLDDKLKELDQKTLEMENNIESFKKEKSEEILKIAKIVKNMYEENN